MRANAELVLEGFKSFNRGDIEAWSEGFHPEVDAQSIDTDVDQSIYRGRAGVRRYVEQWLDLFEELRTEPTEFVTAGDLVFAAFRLHGIAKESGVPIEFPAVYALEIRGGLVVRWRVYRELEEAFEAFGIDSRDPSLRRYAGQDLAPGDGAAALEGKRERPR